MKLVVGLGNPGARYADTRHNVGFAVVERVAARAGVGLSGERFSGRFGLGRVAGQDVGLLLPMTFMNRSGEALAAALEAFSQLDPAADLLVVFDDLDLPFGRLRMRRFGGAGGHRGMEDLIRALGHGEFPRLRFGVGRPPAGLDPVDWVLSPFADAEESLTVVISIRTEFGCTSPKSIGRNSNATPFFSAIFMASFNLSSLSE